MKEIYRNKKEFVAEVKDGNSIHEYGMGRNRHLVLYWDWGTSLDVEPRSIGFKYMFVGSAGIPVKMLRDIAYRVIVKGEREHVNAIIPFSDWHNHSEFHVECIEFDENNRQKVPLSLGRVYALARGRVHETYKAENGIA